MASFLMQAMSGAMALLFGKLIVSANNPMETYRVQRWFPFLLIDYFKNLELLNGIIKTGY